MTQHKPELREMPVTVPPWSHQFSHCHIWAQCPRCEPLGNTAKLLPACLRLLINLPLHTWSLLSGGHEQGCTVHCAASHGYFVLSVFEIVDKHVLQLPTVAIRSSLLYVPLIRREPTTMEDCSLRLKLFASLCDVMCAPLGSGSHSWEKT